MKQGFLSEYFNGIAVKRLSAVEADLGASNQHEMNGVAEMKKIFGKEKHTFSTNFVYLDDSENELGERDRLTWYDSRKNHPVRSEYRLYFPSNAVTEKFSVGDLVVIGRRPDDSVMLITAKAGSSAEQQLIWLFGLTEVKAGKFQVKNINQDDKQLNFASKIIIEELGIEIRENADKFLEIILNKFGEEFPTTRIFSEFARETSGKVDLFNSPDQTLLVWIEHEERLFRTLEKHLVANRLKQGFTENDVDKLIDFSLSLHNRRKSRMGSALENHLEYIFQSLNITHSRGKVTEGKKKPDFIFPGVKNYHDPQFPVEKLTMLGSKSTCKDRWRQVLSEAKRIKNKHLLTLQPGITEDQTSEMQESHLRLVVPMEIHQTYSSRQQKWLMNLNEFIEMVKERQ